MALTLTLLAAVFLPNTPAPVRPETDAAVFLVCPYPDGGGAVNWHRVGFRGITHHAIVEKTAWIRLNGRPSSLAELQRLESREFRGTIWRRPSCPGHNGAVVGMDLER